MEKPSYCSDNCKKCMPAYCHYQIAKSIRPQLEKSLFYEKHMQPYEDDIISIIVKWRQKIASGAEAKALEYLIDDINWYWNEAELGDKETTNEIS